jgi:hypothetical protein
VVNTWRLSVGTSLFVIDILADGSWRPAYIAPKRLGGWTMDVLPNMPPTLVDIAPRYAPGRDSTARM